MLSISVLRGFFTHLETSSVTIHITLSQMLTQVVSKHCKQCSKLVRVDATCQAGGGRLEILLPAKFCATKYIP